MRILVTGAAGFIGSHLAARLLAEGREVTGVDNINPYYDPRLKRARLRWLTAKPGFQFMEADLADHAGAETVFGRGSYDVVVHLAAQAGVRYSLENPHAYTESNVTGFLHVLEGCRRKGIERLIYASSSSVYAGNRKTPFAVGDAVETPVSLYAATKRAGELMAHCYTHLFGIATTGLRFFTVYGPWGRPDMAPFKFVEAIERGRRIDLYNYGRMQRDFTYIDDIVEGLVRVIDRPQTGYRLYNVGHGSPVGLLEFVHTVERALGKRARRRFVPMAAGDVVETHAEVEEFFRYTGFCPATPVAEGVRRLVAWYRDYAQRDDATAGRRMAAV